MARALVCGINSTRQENEGMAFAKITIATMMYLLLRRSRLQQ